MSNKTLSDFTKDSFLDYDQRRGTFGSQPIGTGVGQPPAPGFERVLKISIPFNHKWNKSNGYWKLTLQPSGEPAEINPCGYVNLEDLDEYLERRLCALPTIGINGPRVTGSGRQLIDIDAALYATLFEDAEVPDGVSIPRPDKNNLNRMTSLLDAHERDPETPGSHAYTILNPETRAPAIDWNINMLVEHTLTGTTPETPRTPVRASVYNELYAIAAERRECSRLAERQALDSYRAHAEDPKYALALEILRWLRDNHRLSYAEITALLDLCCYSDTSPIIFLAHMLNDLAKGMPVEEIPYHSSIFDHREKDPSGVYEKKAQYLDLLENSISLRLFSTTIETISLSEGRVIKEWWTRNPPAVFPLPVIRILIHLRDMTNWSEEKYNQPLIATTSPTSSASQLNRHNLVYNGNVVAGLQYQHPRNSISKHPLRVPMDHPISSEKIARMTWIRKPSDTLISYWRSVTRDVVRNIHPFETGDEFINWITGEAAKNAGLNQMVHWFL